MLQIHNKIHLTPTYKQVNGLMLHKENLYVKKYVSNEIMR